MYKGIFKIVIFFSLFVSTENFSQEKELFDLGDKNALLNSVDREILISVATQIMGQETLEETKKN